MHDKRLVFIYKIGACEILKCCLNDLANFRALDLLTTNESRILPRPQF